MKRTGTLAPAVMVVLGVMATLAMGSVDAQSWRTASRAPVGLAPDPAITEEAVAQVYAARAVRWRGYVGVHSWIAVKPHGAAAFTVYEVNGWRLRRTGSAVVVSMMQVTVRNSREAPRR